MAKSFRLYPSDKVEKASSEFYDRMTAEIEKNVRETLITRTNKATGAVIDYVVRAEDGEAIFATKDEAINFITKCTLMPYLEQIERSHAKIKAALAAKQPFIPGQTQMGDGAPDRGQPTDRGGRAPNFPDAESGPEQPSDLLDGDYDQAGNKRRKSLTELHAESMRKRGRQNYKGRSARIQ